MRQGTNWNTAEDEELTAWLEKIAVSEEPISPRREPVDMENMEVAPLAQRRCSRRHRLHCVLLLPALWSESLDK